MKLRLPLTFLIVTLFFISASIGQSYSIDIDIKNYKSDSLIVGYYFGERQLVKDTLISEKKGDFTWSGDEALHTGTYILLTFPEKKFIQFFVNEEYPRFSVTFDNDYMSDITFTNSPDNQLFNDYINFLSTQRPKSEALREEIEKASEKKKEKLQAQLDEVNAEVMAKQDQILKDHPESFTAKSIRAGLPIDYPKPDPNLSDKEKEVHTFYAYRQHYFDHVDISDSTMVYMPFFHDRINYFVNKLTVQSPDTVTQAIDYVLEKMDKDSKMFQYYLGHFYNYYVKAKMVGMDKIVVHLADTYYAKGMAPWTDEETLNKILDNARMVRPSLIGNIGHDIELQLEDGSPIKISDIDYEYLVLMFWAPDCGHCTKAMPSVVEFEEQFRDQNVKLLAVCSKHRDDVPKCWEAISEKGMENFINALDPTGRSRFRSWYDVRTTPKVYILDKDRKIILKGIGADQLSDVMQDIIDDKLN